MAEPETKRCTSSTVHHECESHGPVYYGEGYAPQTEVQLETQAPDKKDGSKSLKIVVGSAAVAGALGETGASIAFIMHESFVAAGAFGTGAIATAAIASGAFLAARNR